MTLYSEIFELVLALMKTYEVDAVYAAEGEDGITEFFIPYLKIASGELEIANSSIDISDRDDTLRQFNKKLTDGEQLIVAKLVMIGYFSEKVYDILQVKLHLQDGDFKTYAEKNNLDGKMNALYTLKEEVDYSLKKKGYSDFEW